MSSTFTKTVEDFVCEHCGTAVKGDGFTNHCPVCLWSKHVDIYPGDRKNSCGGIMEPVEMVLKAGKYDIFHVCLVCGSKRLNKTSKADDFSAILAVSSGASQRRSHRR